MSRLGCSQDAKLLFIAKGNDQLGVLDPVRRAASGDGRNTRGYESIAVRYPASALLVLPDGSLALGGGQKDDSDDPDIRIWDIQRKQSKIELKVNGRGAVGTRGVYSLTLLRDGRLASGHSKGIALWNTQTWLCEAQLEGHGGLGRPVVVLAALPDGRLASSSWSSEIKIWDTQYGVCELTLNHTSDVGTLTVLPDGRLVSGGHDGMIKFWNLQSGLCEVTLYHQMKGRSSQGCFALAMLPDGRLLSGGHGTINLFGEALTPSEQDIASLLNRIEEISWSDKIILAGIPLREEGAKALAELIARNKTIKTIVCTDAEISNVGGMHLLRAVESNSTLEVLHLHGNPMGDDLKQRIQNVFQRRIEEEARQRQLVEERERNRLAEEARQRQLAEQRERDRLAAAEQRERDRLAAEARQRQLAEQRERERREQEARERQRRIEEEKRKREEVVRAPAGRYSWQEVTKACEKCIEENGGELNEKTASYFLRKISVRVEAVKDEQLREPSEIISFIETALEEAARLKVFYKKESSFFDEREKLGRLESEADKLIREARRKKEQGDKAERLVKRLKSGVS